MRPPMRGGRPAGASGNDLDSWSDIGTQLQTGSSAFIRSIGEYLSANKARETSWQIFSRAFRLAGFADCFQRIMYIHSPACGSVRSFPDPKGLEGTVSS